MEEQTEDAQDFQGEVEKWMEGIARYPVEHPLRELGVDEERIAYLCNHNNVLSDLPSASAEDWDLAFATAAQVLRLIYPGYDREKFREENLAHIERLISETESDRPEVQLEWSEIQAHYAAHPRWGTYIYSRIAKASVIHHDDHEQAIQLYDEVLVFFDEDTKPEIRDELIYLYYRVGRYEDALKLLLQDPSALFPAEEWSGFLFATFTDWLERLSRSGGIAEVKRFLDLIYKVDDYIYEDSRGIDKMLHRFIEMISVLDDESVEGIDKERRERLRGWLIETRQYWAWFYGNALGRLIVQRPGLRESLLRELEAGEWSEGWLAGGILFESPRDSWGEYVQWASKFYNAADIEYHHQKFYTSELTDIENSLEQGTPDSARQPPHLSPQSDLYWAMRVGFGDAHIQSGEEESTSLRGIANNVEKLITIASSSALRTQRIEREMDEHWQDISRGMPPTDDHWREGLKPILSSVWDVIQGYTIPYLVRALNMRYQKAPDFQRIAIGQAVESLFQEMVIQRVKRSGESVASIKIPRRTWVEEFPQYRWDRISLYEWAQVLETLQDQRMNLPFGFTLGKAFPELDLKELENLNKELKDISRLRGAASHDSRNSAVSATEQAAQMWDRVVGGVDHEGFIVRFCKALGLVKADSGT